jgi:hypothetical protein
MRQETRSYGIPSRHFEVVGNRKDDSILCPTIFRESNGIEMKRAVSEMEQSE